MVKESERVYSTRRSSVRPLTVKSIVPLKRLTQEVCGNLTGYHAIAVVKRSLTAITQARYTGGITSLSQNLNINSKTTTYITIFVPTLKSGLFKVTVVP